MSISVKYIEQTYNLVIGTVDGITYGTSYLARAEGQDDGDNVYPH